MAKLDEAPLVELSDVFGENDFVGPPELAGPAPVSGQVQSSNRAPATTSGQAKRSTPARSSQAAAAVNRNDLPDSTEASAIPIAYVPAHPALKSPARRGRPPKNAQLQSQNVFQDRNVANNNINPGSLNSVSNTYRTYAGQNNSTTTNNNNNTRVLAPNVRATLAPSRLPAPTGPRTQQIRPAAQPQQSWPASQYQFGQAPRFHTFSNGTPQVQNPPGWPNQYITPAPQQQPPPPPQIPMSMPSSSNNFPRIPSILSNNAQPMAAHSGAFKPPSVRAAILQRVRGPNSAHNNHPTQQAHQQPQPSAFTPNFRTNNTNQFAPQAIPVRPAYQDFLRHVALALPNVNVNELLQRMLSNPTQPIQLSVPNGIDPAVIRDQLQRSLSQSNLRSFIPPNHNPPMTEAQVGQAQRNHCDLALQKLAGLIPPSQAGQQQPQPPKKVVPCEDDIRAQDVGADAQHDEEYHEVETYSDYTPAKLTIGYPHPDPVVETSSLATVEPPDITYKLKLPEKVINDRLVSALQLESVVYASQQHEQFLADERTRRGFLIGDGAGVGKGRTIAAIIYENYLNGRKKSVWLSVSTDLKLDAERDLRDIGADIPVHSLTKFTYGKKIDVGQGVLFSTYSGLVSRSQSVKGSLGNRLGQLVTWLGTKFDGVIVFDECHKAKNISLSAKKKQSKTADFALELQSQLPGARVVYASATGASETRHLGYMTRLGLWGEGTPYQVFPDFCSAIERRGVGAMELVAVDLKMRGSYMARQLSFKTTNFEIRIANLDDAFVRLYDKSVEMWSRALELFIEALTYFSSDKKRTKGMTTAFWGAHQRFFKYLCIGVKVPLVVEIAKQALADGKCVVIGLQSTGEAKTLEALDDGDISEFISTAKATFESLVENYFPAPPGARRSRSPAEKSNEIAHGEAGNSSNSLPEKAGQSSESRPEKNDEPQDAHESSTDLSSVISIDETYHGHDVVKFIVDDGLVRAELDKDMAAQELKQSSHTQRREALEKRKTALEELAKSTKATTKSDRSVRARKRAKTRTTRSSRIKKPIDDSETEVSTPTSDSISETTNPSSDPSENTDDTYSESDEGSSESTLKDSEIATSDEDLSPIRPKRARNSPVAKGILKSDSDSDCEITAVKPRQRDRCEIIILSSDDDDEDDGDSVDSSDPITIHGSRLSAMREELYKMIDDLGPSLPHNSLDDLINQLGGPDAVAEMTGRKGRVVKDEDGLITYKHRNEVDATEYMNIAEKDRFMRGEKLIAIISEAASSGISLQADRRAENQRRRVHITIELPWSADRAIQQFGRTHRSNQVSGPEYVFVISELSGEKRFASVVAKRLESLGALTHGDRRANTESRDLSQFNIAGRYCRQAIEQIVRYLEYGFNDMNIEPGSNFRVEAQQAFLDSGLAKRDNQVYGRFTIEPQVLNVNHFLNRLLGMKVRIQNTIFQLFTDYMDKLIARKKVSGQYDAGILELNSESGKTICGDPEDYYLKTRSGTVKCTLREVQVERGISWDEALKIYKDSTDDSRSGFYVYHGPGTSDMIILLIRDPSSGVDMFRSYKPNTGRQAKPDLFRVLEKGKKSSLNAAQQVWTRIYEYTGSNCVHLCYFGSCKRNENKMVCEVGLRHRFFCILSGGILTAWPYLERKLPAVTEKVQLVRLRLDGNNRVIGPIIPRQYVGQVKNILGSAQSETVVF